MANTKVTGDVIANGTISTVHLADDAITAAKLDSTATGITFADLTVDTNTLYVDAANNRVGIGTTSPQVSLQIGTHLTTPPADTGLCVSNRKSIRINDADGSYNFGVYIKQNYSGNSYLILGTRHNGTDTDGLVVKDGNVGIGTDDPDGKKLRIVHSTGQGLSLSLNSGSGTNVVQFGDTSDSDIGQISYDHTNNFMAFQTNNTERMRIDSSGLVRIQKNTSSTTEPLLKLSNASGSTTDGVKMIFEVANTSGNGGEIAVVRDGGSFNPYMTFNVSSGVASAPTERMRIDSSGNVMMGKNSQSGNAALTVKSMAGGNTGLILIEGDTTNDGHGLYATTDNKFVITRFTNGSYSDNFVMDSSGNLGIGTTSPDLTGFGYKTLTVVGGTTSGYAGVLELGSPTTNANGQNLGIIAFMDGSTRNAQIDVTRASSTSTSNMHFYTNGGSGIVERMRIDSSGLARFTVDSGTASAIDIGYISSARTIRAVETGGGNARPLTLLAQNFTFKDDSATRMTIDSYGNIGMFGQTSPSNYTSSGFGTLHLGTSSTKGLIKFGDGSTWNGPEIYASSGELIILSNDSGSSEKMRIRSSADPLIRIGGGDNEQKAAIRLGGENGGGGRLYFEYNGDSSYIDSYGGHGSTQRYRDLTIGARNLKLLTGNTSGGTRMYIDVDGNVGIGTTSPGYMLHVQSNSSSTSAAFFRPNVIGSADPAEPTTVFIDGQKAAALDINRFYSHGTIINIRQNNSNVGSISVTGVATAYNTSSDYRLKEDYQDFNGLDMVSNIPVYDFKWKSAEERSFGVKAHELQNILPQAVNGEKDAKEMQGVDYSKLTPILLKAIQELKADNDNLRERIQTLENQ